MQGIINLDKPAGLSSAAVVNRVKRLLPRGTRIGHAGTLDPFATGVLLLLVGKATKACESLMDQPKAYETTIKLGGSTATDDLESEEVLTPNATPPDLEQIRVALQKFIGIVQQRPPAYSAMKIGGQRAYDLARRGQAVELQPRSVRIDQIRIVSWQWPLLKIHVACGRGTYIRAIARDLGQALGIGGFLTELRRTQIGRFVAAESVSLDQLMREGVEKHLLQVEQAL